MWNAICSMTYPMKYPQKLLLYIYDVVSNQVESSINMAKMANMANMAKCWAYYHVLGNSIRNSTWRYKYLIFRHTYIPMDLSRKSLGFIGSQKPSKTPLVHWFIGSQPHPQLLRPPFQASKVPAQRLRVHLGAAVATERHQRHHHGGGEESSTDQATQPQTHLGWCRRHGISQLTCFWQDITGLYPN